MTIHQGEEQMLTVTAALAEVGAAAGHVGPGEVVGPVDDVQHPEHRGKHDPGETVDKFYIVHLYLNQNSQHSAKVPTNTLALLFKTAY